MDDSDKKELKLGLEERLLSIGKYRIPKNKKGRAA